MLFALLLCVILQKNDRRLTFVSGLKRGFYPVLRLKDISLKFYLSLTIAFYSSINSIMSSTLQFKTEHSLFMVFVSIFSLALRRRTVLLSIPHSSRSLYVEKPFFFIVSHNLSKIIIISTSVLTFIIMGVIMKNIKGI